MRTCRKTRKTLLQKENGFPVTQHYSREAKKDSTNDMRSIEMGST